MKKELIFCVWQKLCCDKFVHFLHRLLASKLRVKTKQNAAWTVSNLCRGKNPPCNVDDVSVCVCVCVCVCV